MTAPGLKVECKNAALVKGVAGAEQANTAIASTASTDDISPSINVVAVPSHLYHIMFELFKNAMRATVEYHGVDSDLPELKVFIVKGKEDLSIKLCDRGGGVARSVVDVLFNYMYSTAPPPARGSMSLLFVLIDST